jgi:MFS family permease
MAATMSAPLPGAFWRLWTSVTLSNLGDGIRLAAFPLLAVILTQDPRLVAGVAVVQYLPWLLLGLPAGAVADRMDRRRLMSAVSVGRTIALTLLIIALATDTAALPMLYTAAQAAVPQLVPAPSLVRANGRLVSSLVVTDEFVGPLVGAALFTVSVLLPFGVHASLVAVAAILILTLPRLVPDAALASETAVPSAWGSVRWLWAQPALRGMLLLAVALVAADSAWFGLLVLYTTQVLQLPAAAYGVLVAAGAAGGLLGALMTDRATRWLGRGRVFVGSVVLAAVTQIVLGLTASAALTVGLLALSSAAFAAYNVVSTSVRQQLVPSSLLGRVTGAYRTCTMSAAAIGAAGGGLLAAALDITAPFLVGGVLLLAVLAVSIRLIPIATFLE